MEHRRKKNPMIISIVTVTALAVISVAGIAGALVVTMRDGYGRVPTRRF